VRVVVPAVWVTFTVPALLTKLRVLAAVMTPLPLPMDVVLWPEVRVPTAIGPARVMVPLAVSVVKLSPLALFQTVV